MNMAESSIQTIVKNYLIIQGTQNLPSLAGQLIRSLKKALSSGRNAEAQTYLEDVDAFKTAQPKRKRALVMLYPSAWLTAQSQYPNIRLYNHSGFVYSMVKALNESGYLVDLADPHHPFKLKKEYDLFLGHGGFCRPFMEQLKEGTPIYQYISGLYWKVFDKESDARYTRFYEKHGAKKPEQHKRSISAMIEGLEYLNQKADVLFSINCPRMIAAYGPYSHKFFYTGLGAYLDPLLQVNLEEKNYEEGRENFIYVGGTSGNLQKGTDLLLEAFYKTPDLHLYIYCKVEDDILKYSKRELAAPNVHYIYHWRHKPFHKKLRQLLRRTNFSVHAPINIGIGTAFMATMGVGLISVGYIDVPDPEDECAVLSDSWQVDALIDCIQTASQKSSKWCENAAPMMIKKYQKHCDPDHVEENFKKMFAEVGELKKGGCVTVEL